MNPLRPHIESTAATLAVAAYLVLFTNVALWRALFELPSGAPWALIATVVLAVTTVFNLVLMLVATPRSFKPVAVTLLLIAAVTSYFLSRLGVIINAETIRNVVETDVREATELVSAPFFLHILLVGVVPSVLLGRARIRHLPFRSEVRRRGLIAVGSLLLSLGFVALSYKDLTLTVRQNPRLRMLLNPSYPIYSLFKYIRKQGSVPRAEAIVVGADARRAEPLGITRKPRLLILVIGETARARQFSLNGYERDTNPNLQALDVVNFPHVSSGGTSTAESLPGMFSDLTSRQYSPEAARARENLLDVVQRSGVRVLWRDNNSGCKHICERVPSEDLSHRTNPNLCNAEECYDEILLDGLQSYVDANPGDILVVMHQKGSHGPAYYKRVPAAFERFTPICAQDDVQNCDTASIVNAYDNTILYTDFVLSRMIAFLRQNADSREAALLYVSDHGESLGENGIYLHGFPMRIAPEEQTHVPMIFWASEGFYTDGNIDSACLRTMAHQRDLSHSNLFHSVLGALQIRTSAYDPTLDFFQPCRVSPMEARAD